MKEEQKGSRHADLAIQYWTAAKENAEEWKNWQCRSCTEMGWVDVITNPAFFPEFEYRRKPETIMVGDVEVPKPLESAEYDQFLWAAGAGTVKYNLRFITSNKFHTGLLKDGLLHATEEAATIHTNAIRKLLNLDPIK